MYGPRARGEVNQQVLDLAEFLLKKVGLQDFRHKYPTQLSGGMQRRAELARAMINNPSVMILDEPFRGLDAMTKQLMWEYYATLYEENRRTNFFVTTDIDEAIFLADRLLIMSNIPTQVRAVLEVDVPFRMGATTRWMRSATAPSIASWPRVGSISSRSIRARSRSTSC